MGSRLTRSRSRSTPGWGDTIIVIVGLPDAAVQGIPRPRPDRAHQFRLQISHGPHHDQPRARRREEGRTELRSAHRPRHARRQRTDRNRPARQLRHRRRTGADRRRAPGQRRAARSPFAPEPTAKPACWSPPTTRPKPRSSPACRSSRSRICREAAGFLEGEIKIVADEGGHRQNLRSRPR